MDWQTAFNAVLGFVMLLAGYILRSTNRDINTLEERMSQHEKYSADTYIRRDDYRDDMAEIKAMLRTLLKKIDEKADK